MFIYLRYDAQKRVNRWLVIVQTIKADTLTEKIVGTADTVSSASRVAFMYTLKHPPGTVVDKKPHTVSK